MASRARIDKTLQRTVDRGELRRVGRGLYDRPRRNPLTGTLTVPDPRAVIQAVMRREKARYVVDGITAANNLGLTTAVPAHIVVLVDTRLKPIRLGNQLIRFRMAAPSRLFWAGRPAMRVVQALYWLHDLLSNETEMQKITDRLSRVLADPIHGPAIRDDLHSGLSAMPIWMQHIVRELLKTREPDRHLKRATK